MSDHEPITEADFSLIGFVQALVEIALLGDDAPVDRAREIAMQALKWDVIPDDVRDQQRARGR
jgi:hypothetical protein